MRAICTAAIGAILFVTIVLYGAAHSWLGVDLKAEVRPLEAITLATNLLIAFFLQRFVTTKINDLRAEKNVLIAEVSTTIHLLSEIRERTAQLLLKTSVSDEENFAVISGFRRIANAINDLQASAEMSHIKSISKAIQPLWPDFFELKALATGRGFPSKGYTIDEQTSQERLFRALTTRLRRLIFTINDARN